MAEGRYVVHTWWSQEANPSRRLWAIRDRHNNGVYVSKGFDREAPAQKLCDRMNADQDRLNAFYYENRRTDPKAADG